jgi:BlaI family penicillinase repressor
MADKKEPTKSELEILQVLWIYGPNTVRFVNDRLNEQNRDVRYTSTLKLMQIMVEKELLARDESTMKHIYYPAEDEQKTKADLLTKFLHSTFNGSVGSMALHLLGNQKPSKLELEEIKALIAKLEK